MELTGRKLGKYEVLERLGQGGMAAVYKAFQPGVERHVALKVMHSHLADSDDFVARFRREAQSIGRLQHPHIARVIDFDVEADIYYMVMDFIEGGTLQEYLKGKSPLAMEEAVEITMQLADALAYAHERNMVHRDIKPGNVMFMDMAHTHALLTDFGIARLLDDQFAHLTMTGASVGTPTYMSPEAALGEVPPDGRADIYSLGVMLFEMVTGRAPYIAETPFALMMKQANEPIPSPLTFNPNIPKALEPILQKAMAKATDDRYQSAPEFKEALGGLLAGNSDSPSRKAAQPQKGVQRMEKPQKVVDPAVRKRNHNRNRSLALAGGGVLLIALLTSWLLLSFGQSRTANGPQPVAQIATAAATTASPAVAESPVAAVATATTPPIIDPTVAPTADLPAIATGITTGTALTESTIISTAVDSAAADAAALSADAISTTVTITDTGTTTGTTIGTEIAAATETAAVSATVSLTATTAITSSAITSTAITSTAAAILTPRPLGSLSFNSTSTGETAFQLQLSYLAQPPAAQQYALWLIGDAENRLRLASFAPQQRHLFYAGTFTGTLPLTAYQMALIGLESIDATGLTLPETVIYSSTISGPATAPLTTLLTTNPLDNDQIGLLAAAQAQSVLAVSHGGFLQDALAADDMVEAHRHAEHLVNILDGERGDFYGDLDRDGTPQNPGNGVGVLVYLEAIRDQLTTISNADGEDRSISAGLELVTDLHTQAEAARGTAVQIIAADSPAEAQPRADLLVTQLAAIDGSNDIASAGQSIAAQSAGGLATLNAMTEQLLTYHFVDPQRQIVQTAGNGTLHFYKAVSATTAIMDDTAGATTGSSSYGNSYSNDGSSNDGNAASSAGLSSATVDADAFYLLLDGVTVPPAGQHYELVLQKSGDQSRLVLGRPTLVMGRGLLSGTLDSGVLTVYDQARLIVMPNATEGTAYYVAERSPELQALLNNLLVANDETGIGLVGGATRELALAVLHTDFLQDELDQEDLVEARRHAEHVLNIVVGKAGQFYGDRDGDGFPQNPGDGFGVIPYLDRIESALTTLLDEAEINGEVRLAAEELRDLTVKNRQLIDRSKETTLRVFAADTAAEVQLFEEEMRALLSDALYGVDRNGDGVIEANVTEGGINALADQVLALGTFVFVQAGDE